MSQLISKHSLVTSGTYYTWFKGSFNLFTVICKILASTDIFCLGEKDLSLCNGPNSLNTNLQLRIILIIDYLKEKCEKMWAIVKKSRALGLSSLLSNSQQSAKGDGLADYLWLLEERRLFQQRQWACGGDQGGGQPGDGREGEGEGGLRTTDF